MTYGPLIDLPLQSYYLEEDPSRSLLVDSSMDAPTFAAWVTADGTFTKVLGSLSGTGTRYAQVDYDGVHATAYMYQAGQFIVGAKYRFRAWGQTDALGGLLTADDGLTTILIGTAAPAIQSFNIVFTATGTVLALRNLNLAANRFGRWDDVSVSPFIVRTKNVGMLGGGVQLGPDGLTATNFPTMIGAGKRGMNFAAVGGQRLTWPGVLASGTYTIAMTFQNNTNPASATYFFDARDSGGVGYSLINAGNIYSQSSGSTYLNGRPFVGGVDSIPYGTFGTLVASGITLQSVTKIVLGARSDGAFPWNGNIFGVELWPYAFSASQARAYDERARGTLNFF